MSKLLQIAVTGAGGQIGYTLLFCLSFGWAKEKLKITLDELRAERKFVADLTESCA